MANYQTPGVYVEEIASLPGSVVGVPSAVPCFIGYTDLHDKNVAQVDPEEDDSATYPVLISSMAEYERIFGGPHVEFSLAINKASGSSDWVLGAMTLRANSTKHMMYPMLKHYFMNGGGPCYVVSVATHNGIPTSGTAPVDGDAYLLGVDAAVYAEDATMLVLTDATGISTSTDYYDVAVHALTQCHNRKDRMTILDFPGAMVAGASTFRTDIGSQYLSYGAVYGPFLETSIPVTYGPRNITLSIQSGAIANPGGTLLKVGLDVVLASSIGSSDSTALLVVEQINKTNLMQFIESNAKTLIPSMNNVTAGGSYILPPSGAIAGIIAKTDRERGVWVAPANVSIAGVKAVTERYTASELDGFNVPTDGQGKSINVIRTVQGRGHMVMGARTLLGNSLEWRYVNVRRTFIFVEESIQLALAPVVFEPNDFATWNRVRTMIEGFLTGLWRQGALMGRKSEEAFFVKVGLGSTMTAEDILAGKLIIEVGLAAVRPAEFIIIKFSHLLQQA